jgi:hypothetical protein
MTLTQLVSSFVACSALLTSCSSVENGLASVKEKAFGKDEDQLQLTKANPARFLPKSTDANEIRTNPAFQQQQRRLLAKNTRSQNQANEMPALELPPPPESDDLAPEGYSGILPSLDGQDAPTSITVDGDTPELPPLPTPEDLPELETSDS